MRIVGSVGLPEVSKAALLEALKGAHWPRLSLTLVAPWQGARERTGYAALVFGTPEPVLTPPAFGPAYGEAGERALAELLEVFAKHGVRRIFEAALAPGELAALTEGEEALLARAAAARNPLSRERVPAG